MMLLAEPCVSSLVTELKSATKRRQGLEAANAWNFYRRVNNMYSWARVAKETTGIYDEVMDRDRLTYLERAWHVTCRLEDSPVM